MAPVLICLQRPFESETPTLQFTAVFFFFFSHDSIDSQRVGIAGRDPERTDLALPSGLWGN